MDATEELGKDIRGANQGARSEVFKEESPPTDSEGEQHSLKKFVELQPEKLDAMDVEFPIDQSLAEHADVDKTVDANLDACADANSNDHANVNMDTNLKVGASVSRAEDSSRDDVVGNNRAHATCVDPNVSVDASLEAGANMNSHLSMDANANTSTNADLDANTELDVNPHIEGDAKIEVDVNTKTDAIINSNTNIGVDADVAGQHVGVIDGYSINPSTHLKSDSLDRTTSESKSEEHEREEEVKNVVNGIELLPGKEFKDKISKSDLNGVNVKGLSQSFLWNSQMDEGSESGSEVEQAAFMDELESFFKERSMEFKPPKFYGEGLNLLKLWRAVTRLGGYDQVTSCKLWRQVGESFKPPKTCTTVSWTFRCFYEKALLEYEKSKMHGGELSLSDASFMGPSTAGNQVSGNTTSGRARRDAAARAMQGWHSQRLLGNGEVGDPIIKDKNSSSLKREKQLKSIGFLKRKKPSSVDRAIKAAHLKVTKLQLDTMVVDIGSPADWVKVNVQKTKDCYEVYALVPGLLREEVRVQSDPAGRLVISGLPEHLDNPWGVTPFKKVVSLPSRIDPHQTSAVVTLHGQLFVRVPFEQ